MSYSIDPLTGQVRVSGGNATVPSNAPILPPQAFVDSIAEFIHSPFIGNTLSCANKGIVSIDIDEDNIGQSVLGCWTAAASDDSPDAHTYDFSGNLFDQATEDKVLFSVANFTSGAPNPPTLDLTGPRMPVPTVDGVSVLGAGTATANGGYTPRGTANGKPYYNNILTGDSTTQSVIIWTGPAWALKDDGAVTLYTGAGGAHPWDATWSAVIGGSPAPTVTQDNASRAQIIAAGGTVTTN